MTRYVIVVGVLAGALLAAFIAGQRIEAAKWRTQIAEAKEAAREATDKLEAARLADMAELDRLYKLLQDEAINAPVASACAVPVDRVRRLNRLK